MQFTMKEWIPSCADSAMTVGASLTVPMALNPKTMGGALVEFST